VLLNQLEIIQFKNHAHTKFEFSKPINFFIGQNGIGKTNILDAIYFLSVFRSHIQHLDSQLILHGEPFFRLKGNFQSKFSSDYEVVVKYAYRSKSIEINRLKIAKYSEYFGHIPLVISNPSDIFLLYEGSEERRKLIDYTISIQNKKYLLKLNLYQQYLEQRNAHLKNEDNIDINLLNHYNAHLSELGHYIFDIRLIFAEEFNPLISKWYEIIANKDEEISIEYSSHLKENNLADLLQKNLEKDKILKRTTKGIHRDDLKIEMNNIDIKKIASQGQQKSLLYAIRLAQAEWISMKMNQKIIFLLDDFSDKLDGMRKQMLLKSIQEIDFIEQWFITDTSDNHLEENENTAIYRLA